MTSQLKQSRPTAIFMLVFAGTQVVLGFGSWPGSHLFGSNSIGQSVGVSFLFWMIGLWVGSWGIFSLLPSPRQQTRASANEEVTLRPHPRDQVFTLVVGVLGGVMMVSFAAFLLLEKSLTGVVASVLGVGMAYGTVWQWQASSRVRLRLTGGTLSYTDRRNRTRIWVVSGLQGAGFVPDYWAGNAMRLRLWDGASQLIRLASMDLDEADTLMRRLLQAGVPLLPDSTASSLRGPKSRPRFA